MYPPFLSTFQRVRATARAFGAALARTQQQQLLLPPARPLSHLTMGFDEIEQWKEDKRRQAMFADPNYTGPKPTIFDLKIFTPIRKSDVWNISYAPDDRPKTSSESPKKAKQTAIKLSPSYDSAAPRPLDTVESESKNKKDAGKPSKRDRDTTARAAAAHMARVTRYRVRDRRDVPELFWDADCWRERAAGEITGVPGLHVLRKLRVEAESVRDYVVTPYEEEEDEVVVEEIREARTDIDPRDVPELFWDADCWRRERRSWEITGVPPLSVLGKLRAGPEPVRKGEENREEEERADREDKDKDKDKDVSKTKADDKEKGMAIPIPAPRATAASRPRE